MMLKKALRRIIPASWLNRYHYVWAFLGAVLYWLPSRRLIVIGVTGTKGKTSTVHYIVKILEASGYKVGAVSGYAIQIGASVRRNPYKMSMPGRMFLQRMLRYMVYAGCTHAVLEVTSEGIAQHRHEFIDFDTVVFTNIAPEHIESHGGFEAYLAAKLELFAAIERSRRFKTMKGKTRNIPTSIVVNGDDRHAEDFLAFRADRKLSCHIRTPGFTEEGLAPRERIIAESPQVAGGATSFKVRGTPFRLETPGLFAISNALCAIGVGMTEGCSLSHMAKALAGMKALPGRMERIMSGRGFSVVVDHAHTPDSLAAVYGTLRNELAESGKKGKRLLCVLWSAGGGRDRWKRPVLGAIAGVWGDAVTVTNEDPFDEDPLTIIHEVANGARDALRVYGGYFGEEILRELRTTAIPEPLEISERREAIRNALTEAQPGDIVVITGKGAETSIAVRGGRKVPWDDRAVVREELAKLGKA